jgi:hypothetical protein
VTELTAKEKDKIKEREVKTLKDVEQKENDNKSKGIDKMQKYNAEQLQKEKDDFRRKQQKELQKIKDNLALKTLMVESDMENEDSQHLLLSKENHMLDAENKK